MIDIHCHILPNLDDGAKTMGESVEMARQAAADGIHTICATPHIKPPFLPPERIALSRSLLNKRLAAENIPVTVLAGGDVSAFDMPPDLEPYLLHEGPYLLVEFPHEYMPAGAKQLLVGLAARGLVPVITHPERNHGVIENPNRLLELVEGQVRVQITADSLTGLFGKDAEACARFLLKKRVVHFLATDAHSPDRRRPVLSKGLAVAGEILGKEAARRLVIDNPRAVIEGRKEKQRSEI